MDNLISKRAAIDYFVTNVGWYDDDGYRIEDSEDLREIWTELFDGIPTVQPEISTLIKKIRFWINSNNRNNADYQIVDEIEKIINEYERASNDRNYCETYNPDDGSM